MVKYQNNEKYFLIDSGHLSFIIRKNDKIVAISLNAKL